MRSGRTGALVAGIVIALAAPAASAAAPESTASKACSNGKTATIAGKRTCLAPGRSCTRRYEKQYKAKGYSCRRKNGRYKLVGLRQQFDF
jgi:hypothetical protein